MLLSQEPNATQRRPKGQTVGYIRVSTKEQNTVRQLDGIDLDRAFEDTASAKDTHRPQLRIMLAYVRQGDTVLVHSMDRLARNLNDLRALVSELNGKGVIVRFMRENLTFTGEDSPMSNLLLSMLGAVAQFERDMIQERQREGIKLAKERGVYKGRKPSLNSGQIADIRERIREGQSPTKVARVYDVHRGTIYKYIGKKGAKNGSTTGIFGTSGLGDML